MSKKLDNTLLELTDIFEKCIKINNEYKTKHEELKEIYIAYKKLIKNCDSEIIHQDLFKILTDIDYKLITKDNLNQLIVDQSNMMREFNEINTKIKDLFPKYS